VAVLKLIKTASGYNINVPNDHFYSVFNTEVMNKQKDGDYPKMFIVTDEGRSSQEVSGRQELILNFLVIGVVKKISANDDPQALIEKLIEDIEKAIRLNDTLMGSVQNAEVTGFTTDSGASYPEGIAVLRVETVRYWFE
jgi:hypothetical protein